MHQAPSKFTRSSGIVGLLVWLPLTIGSPARASGAIGGRPVERAFQLSGLENQVREWPELTLAARDEARRRLDHGSWQRLAAATAAAFAPERLRLSIQNGLSRDASAERAVAIVAFYEGELGRRVQDGRRRARGRSMLRDWPRRLSRHLAEGMPVARRRALSRLDAARGISRARLAVASAVAQSLARASGVLACATPRQKSALASRARAQVKRLQKPVLSIVRVELNLRYGDLSSAELERYAGFSSEGAGQWLVAGVLRQLDQALARAETLLLAEIEPVAAERCAAGGSQGTFSSAP